MATKIQYCSNTGLLYVNGVAFTKEMIERVKSTIAQKTDQFEYGLLVIDNVNEESVVIAEKVLHDIEEAACKYDVASDEDFKD